MKKFNYFSIKKILFLICISTICFMFMDIQTFAKEIIKKGNHNPSAYEYDDHANDIVFNMKNDGIPFISIKIKDSYEDIDKDSRLTVILYKVTQVREYDDILDEYEEYKKYKKIDRFKFSPLDTGLKLWYYPDVPLERGEYTFAISGDVDTISYTIEYYASYATSLTFPSTISVPANKEKRIPIQYISPQNALPVLNFESNKKESSAMYWDIDSNCYKIYGVDPGKYIFSATLANGKKCLVRATITNGKPKLQYTSCTLYKGEKIQNEIWYNTKPVKWKSSNPKIATVSKTGKIQGKKTGSCVITAKVDGKTLKCKVKVVYQDPNFGAYLYDYDTRSNSFIIKFKNWGNKPLTIYSSKAYSMDVDYKSYDRKLYLSKKKIKIPAGKSKTVKFKIKGGYTWPDYTDHTIRYYFSYDGKKYLGSTWYEDSVFKSGKKWYLTYWDENKYNKWCPNAYDI